MNYKKKWLGVFQSGEATPSSPKIILSLIAPATDQAEEVNHANVDP